MHDALLGAAWASRAADAQLRQLAMLFLVALRDLQVRGRWVGVVRAWCVGAVRAWRRGWRIRAWGT